MRDYFGVIFPDGMDLQNPVFGCEKMVDALRFAANNAGMPIRCDEVSGGYQIIVIQELQSSDVGAFHSALPAEAYSLVDILRLDVKSTI